MSSLDLAIAFNDEKFEGIKLAADWIRDLESSDSRLHKESVIEKALMAAKLGSANAQCFLFNCYQAYNPYYVFGVKKVPETIGLEHKDEAESYGFPTCDANTYFRMYRFWLKREYKHQLDSSK